MKGFCQIMNMKKEQLTSLISPAVQQKGVEESCESNTDQANSNNRNDKKDNSRTDVNLSRKSTKTSTDSQLTEASLEKKNAMDNEKKRTHVKHVRKAKFSLK